MDITERFLNYTQFDTQSAEDSDSVPSTSKQLIFAEYLKKELEKEGLDDVELDEKGYLYATLKVLSPTTIPVLIVRVQTSNHRLYETMTARTSCCPKELSAVRRSSLSYCNMWVKISS